MICAYDKLGIDSSIDQYEISPPEGWPRWSRNQIKQADFVLVVCTETYEERFEGSGSRGTGAGAKWEGAIITQELYNSEGNNTKFIPIVLTLTMSNTFPQRCEVELTTSLTAKVNTMIYIDTSQTNQKLLSVS